MLVGYLHPGGERSPASLETADFDVVVAEDAAGVPARVDCVVCHVADGWQRAVNALRDRAIPVVVTGAAAAAVAVDASRLGAEFAPANELAAREETLADRIRACVAADDGSTSGSVSAVERTLERTDEAVFAVDADWTFTYANERAGQMFERAPETLVGRDLCAEFPDAASDIYDEKLREALETQASVEFEAYYPPLDIWTGVRAYPDADGLSVFVDDATAQKRRQLQYEALIESSRSLLAAETPEAVAETIQRAVTDLGFEYNCVRLYDATDDTLQPVAMSERAEAELTPRPTYEPGEGFPGQVYEQGRSMHVADLAAADPDADTHLGELRSAFYLPLGEVGVVSVGGPEPAAFDATDRQLLELLAVSADAAISRTERERRLHRYRAVLENTSKMAYALDADGYITLVTDALADRWDLDPEAVVGEHVLEFVDETLVEQTTERLAATESDAIVIELGRGTAGLDVPVELHVSPIADDRDQGVVGVLNDISELEATRTDLEHQRDRFECLFQELPDPVVGIRVENDTHVVQNVNPAFAETFVDADETAVGERIVDVVELPDDGERSFSIDHGEGIVERQAERVTTDGTRTFAFRAVPFRTGGERLVFGIYVDITDQIERQDRLEMLHRVLRHNLRNRLTVIDGNAAMLADEVDGDPGVTLLDGIRSAAASLTALSETSNALQRAISTPESELSREPIGDIVRRIVDDEDKLQSDAATDAVVDGNEHVVRALEELVDNAMSHGAPPVRVTAMADEDTVTVRVTDSGEGVPEREQHVLTGEAEITQLTHSRGLGLWLVRYVATSLGGGLTFEDDGRAVVLSLPRAD